MKKHIWPVFYSIVLVAFTIYISLDTFVIAKSYDTNATEINTTMFSEIEKKKFGKHKRPDFDNSSATPSTYTGETTYSDSNVSVEITQYTEYDTQIYVADVTLSSAQYLKTAFANDTYGKNITETTSSIAEANNAILAINGDYYGVQESGYVQKLGVKTAYNLDGGGFSTMYFNGHVVNNPTTGGRIREREVSDIVYIS